MASVYTVPTEDVYRSTTTSAPSHQSPLTLLESLKRYVTNPQPSYPAETAGEREAFIERGPRPRSRKMPVSTTSAEEASLLGRSQPADASDEIELKSVQLQFPASRTLDKNASFCQEERVISIKGSLLVAVQGDRTKPAIITYHDLGLNHVANFQAFFNFSEMRSLAQNFCIFHVNAPGQEEGAATLPEGFIYPTVDELAEQLLDVMTHFGLKTFIGLGVGAGANILVRFALANADKVDALCLLNCVSTTAGWIEWGYQKLNARHLRTKGMTQGPLDYLMWHHFGRLTQERNHDLVHVYREYFEHHVNPVNLALFIDSYVRRTDLAIIRELDPARKNAVKTVKVPVLNMTGALSPHVEDTVTFNARLDPGSSTWMKIQDCGMVLEEQPAKVVEAFRLFLQGNGYAIKLARKTSVPAKEGSLSPSSTIPLNSSTPGSPVTDSPVEGDIRITENPISVGNGPTAVVA